jgi:hypothetical protein
MAAFTLVLISVRGWANIHFTIQYFSIVPWRHMAEWRYNTNLQEIILKFSVSVMQQSLASNTYTEHVQEPWHLWHRRCFNSSVNFCLCLFHANHVTSLISSICNCIYWCTNSCHLSIFISHSLFRKRNKFTAIIHSSSDRIMEVSWTILHILHWMKTSI